MNPFKNFNEKSLDEPLPFTPEGFQGGGYVFNYKKHGLSKRAFMQRSAIRRCINALWFSIINLGLPIAAVVYLWNPLANGSLMGQLFLTVLVAVSLTWMWVTLPYALFFIRIIKRQQ